MEPRGRDESEMSTAEQSVELLKIEIEARDKRIKALEQLLERDELTGAFNRRRFKEEVDKSRPKINNNIRRENEKTEPKRKMSLLFLDIDHFKQINDTFGHDAGDEVLRATAQHLNGSVRDRDVVGRWGGEEFVVVFNGSDSGAILQKFRKPGKDGKPEIGFEINLNNAPFLVTFSGGVTDLRLGEDLEEAISRADQAMYKAKHNGRNQIVLFEEQEKRVE
jgi:diguanylate cyclase (GGDEF)-like protein